MLPGIIPQHNLANFPFGNDSYTKLLLHCDGANNSTSFVDASPSVRGSATVAGGAKVSTAQSKFGGASAVFAGTGDYLTYPAHADFDFGSGDWCIDFWAKLTDFAAQYAYFGKCNSALTNGFEYYINPNGQIQLVWLPSDGGLNSANSAVGKVADTNWHHYAAVRDGIYIGHAIDGAWAAVNTIGAAASIVANTELFYVGKAGAYPMPFKGSIEEFRVTKGNRRWPVNVPFKPPAAPYSGMPTPPTLGNDAFTKLLLHLDAANGSTVFTDNSLAAHGNASNIGAPVISTAQNKFGGSSLYLDGASYIYWASSADYDFGAGDFTIDWWEYPLSTGTGRMVICRHNNSTNMPFLVGYDVGGNSCVYFSSNNAAWDIAAAVSIGARSVNVWQHFAIVRNGNTFTGYKNGAQTAQFTSSAALAAGSLPMLIGCFTSGQYFHGYIDELRISKAKARWLAPFSPPTAPYS